MNEVCENIKKLFSKQVKKTSDTSLESACTIYSSLSSTDDDVDTEPKKLHSKRKKSTPPKKWKDVKVHINLCSLLKCKNQQFLFLAITHVILKFLLQMFKTG